MPSNKGTQRRLAVRIRWISSNHKSPNVELLTYIYKGICLIVYGVDVGYFQLELDIQLNIGSFPMLDSGCGIYEGI